MRNLLIFIEYSFVEGGMAVFLLVRKYYTCTINDELWLFKALQASRVSSNGLTIGIILSSWNSKLNGCIERFVNIYGVHIMKVCLLPCIVNTLVID